MNAMKALSATLLFAACAHQSADSSATAENGTPVAEAKKTEMGQMAATADATTAEGAAATPLTPAVFAPATSVKIVHLNKADAPEQTVTDATQIKAWLSAIGTAPASSEVAKCKPELRMVFMEGETNHGSVAFCAATLKEGQARIDVGDRFGGIKVENPELLQGLISGEG